MMVYKPSDLMRLEFGSRILSYITGKHVTDKVRLGKVG